MPGMETRPGDPAYAYRIQTPPDPCFQARRGLQPPAVLLQAAMEDDIHNDERTADAHISRIRKNRR